MSRRAVGLAAALRLGAILVVLIAGGACSNDRPLATFPPLTLEVVINRTETPVLTGVGVVAPCSELVVDQATLVRWAAEVGRPGGPAVAPDAVDLSREAGEVPGRTGPLITIITAQGTTYSAALDRGSLPACAGRAVPATYPN